MIAAAITAMLPMKYQYPPGLTLLIAAPFLLGFMGYQHGVWIAFAGLLAFVSMFRHPLKYFGKRAFALRARPPEALGGVPEQ